MFHIVFKFSFQISRYTYSFEKLIDAHSKLPLLRWVIKFKQKSFWSKVVNTAFKTRPSSIHLNKFALGYRTKYFIEDSYKVFQRNMRDIIFVVLISLRMATLLLTVLSKKHLNSVLQLCLTARIWNKNVTPQVTQAHYL